ncbi:MAG: hypothetical protein Fur0044_17670 [Anaerolineae bacterium]
MGNIEGARKVAKRSGEGVKLYMFYDDNAQYIPDFDRRGMDFDQDFIVLGGGRCHFCQFENIG